MEDQYMIKAKISAKCFSILGSDWSAKWCFSRFASMCLTPFLKKGTMLDILQAQRSWSKRKSDFILEISCSSGWVCCYCKWFEIYAGQECKQLLLAISNDCYQFYYSQAGKGNALKNTNISNLDCTDSAHYCLRVLLLSIFANSWQQILVNNILVRAEGPPRVPKKVWCPAPPPGSSWLCYFLGLCSSSFLVNIG